MLEFDKRWRFDSPGPVDPVIVQGFRELIDRISGQASRKMVLEHFKSYFAIAAGSSPYTSSDESWASSDLDMRMEEASVNAPVFIEAFHEACEELCHKHPKMAVPDIGRINRVLTEAGADYQIAPPKLISTRAHIPISVPAAPPSLDEQARTLIKQALDASDRALSEGNGRQAVQEVLWLLETISTAFRNSEILDGSIQGRYFNKIIGELRQRGRGHQEQILSWMMTLHGYLSSPTGGGVRHGVDLENGLALQINESRLYCNLIRSYLTFLISEHERIIREAG